SAGVPGWGAWACGTPSRSSTSWPLLVSLGLCERKAEAGEERARLVVGLRGGRDRHVEAANLCNVVVVDLGKDDLLAQADRVVPPAVERAGAETPKVTNAGQGDGDEPVEKFVHTRPAQGHLRPH